MAGPIALMAAAYIDKCKQKKKETQFTENVEIW